MGAGEGGVAEGGENAGEEVADCVTGGGSEGSEVGEALGMGGGCVDWMREATSRLGRSGTGLEVGYEGGKGGTDASTWLMRSRLVYFMTFVGEGGGVKRRRAGRAWMGVVDCS